MNELIDFIAWLVTHPIQFTILIASEFIVLYWVYYRFKENRILKYLFGAFFQPQNFLFNVVVMSIIGLEIPKEWFTTARLKRWKWLPHDSKINKWRITIGWKVCELMNKVDPDHCK
jgi:hypothetical protein